MLEQNGQYARTENLNLTAQFTQKMEELEQPQGDIKFLSEEVVIGKIERIRERNQNRIAKKDLQLETANATIEEMMGKIVRLRERNEKRIEKRELLLENTKVTIEELKNEHLVKIEQLNLLHAQQLEALEAEKTIAIENAVKSSPNESFGLQLEFMKKIQTMATEHSEKINEINSFNDKVHEKLAVELKFKEDFLKKHYEIEIQRLKEENEKLGSSNEIAINNLENEFRTKQADLQTQYENEIQSLKSKNFDAINEIEQLTSKIESSSENQVKALKEEHSLALSKINENHDKQIQDLESKYNTISAELAEFEKSKTKEIEALTEALETERNQHAKEKRKLGKELNGVKADLFQVEQDKDFFSSNYEYQKKIIQDLTNEKSDLITQLSEVRKEKQSLAIAKEQYDIRDIVDSTDLRPKHKDILKNKSGTYLQYITLPKVQEVIEKIGYLTDVIANNPDTRFKFIMNGDDWEGDVEAESDNSNENTLSFNTSTINLAFTKSTFDLGGSTFLTNSVILGERSPDADTLTGLSNYFYRFHSSLIEAINTKTNAPLSLNDNLILGRVKMMQQV